LKAFNLPNMTSVFCFTMHFAAESAFFSACIFNQWKHRLFFYCSSVERCKVQFSKKNNNSYNVNLHSILSIFS